MSGSLLELLRALSRREVEYILVGGMAGVLHGAPIVTADLDIVHRRTEDNVARILGLLESLQATFRGDDRALVPRVSHLMGQGHSLLSTSLGPVDFLCEVQGEGYEELESFSEPLILGQGLSARVLGLEKLIEQKAAAGRPKDQMALPILRATLKEKNRER